jgi:hypothetical protein
VKIPELHRTIMSGEYQFVVLTDADMIFSDLRLPFEMLLSHWNITSDIALAGAIDPIGDVNLDSKGKLNINSGFIIAQNTSHINEVMLDWINCPTNVKFPDCNQFLAFGAAFHDQGALSEYVRYEWPDQIREIPFFEANGCEGKFVQHLWCNKRGLPDVLMHQLAKLFMRGALQNLLANWTSHHVDMVKYPQPILEGVSTAFSDLPRPTAAINQTNVVGGKPAPKPVEPTLIPEPTPAEKAPEKEAEKASTEDPEPPKEAPKEPAKQDEKAHTEDIEPAKDAPKEPTKEESKPAEPAKEETKASDIEGDKASDVGA